MAIATVRTILVASGAVTALVPAANITALMRPQGLTIPAVTLQRITLTPFNHLRGDGDLDANIVQLDVWNDDYTEARAIAAACRTALQTAGLSMNQESEGYESETDPELYRVTQSWSVFTS
jgi:hypothetical protein